MDSTARFIAVVSGIQGGKTTIGAIWLLSEIQKNRLAGKTGDYLIAAPTVNIIQQSTLPKFKQLFPHDWGVWREARRCFELSWGGYIYIRSTDDPEHLEGMTALSAWLDEVGQMKEQVWINVQGRLSINEGRCIMTTTPYAQNWFYREIIKKAGKDVNIELVAWGSGDNPGFPQDEINRARESLPKAIFERRYMGKFTQLEGLVYPEFEPDECIVEAFDLPDKWTKFGGMDFGYSMPTVVVCLAEDPDTHIFYAYKEYYKTETILKSVSAFLTTEPLKYVLADPQGAQQIAELNKFHGNRNVRAADNSLDMGIERIGMLIKEGRLKFFKGRCTNTIDEIESYSYPAVNADRQSGRDKPIKKNDHCMDALRYAFSRTSVGMYPGIIDSRKTVKQKVRARMSRLDSSVNFYTGYAE